MMGDDTQLGEDDLRSRPTSSVRVGEADSPAPLLDKVAKSEFSQLKNTSTRLSSLTQQEAAVILEGFEASSAHPQNWANSRKWRIALTVALTGFTSTSGSSIGVPGIHEIMAEFGISNEKVGILITSAYVLGLGVGPFVYAPISELYGKQTAYFLSFGPYVLFTIGTALSRNMASLVVLRFLCGCCGSAGPSLGVATCADLFHPSERGRPISIYAIGPMAGPVLGSMIGYWILYGGWRWLFWCMTILSALNLVILICLTEETYAPVIEKILRYRVRHPKEKPSTLAERLSPRRFFHNLGWMGAMVSRAEARAVFGKAFSRPPRLLLTNPVCLIFSLYYAYIYGIIYLFLVSVPLLFGSSPFDRSELFSYHWPQYTLSLSYVGMAIGFAIAATLATNVQDRIYKYCTAKYDPTGKGQPEFRLILTQTGMIIMPVGLFIFGWTAHAEVHWMGPQVGMALTALGLMLSFNSLQNL